jgi:hypothetical protein
MIRNLLMFAALRRPVILGLTGLGLLIATPGAQAQWFNLGFGLRPDQVEREIVASGYQLMGPVERNGGVYLADVVGRGGDRQRLVVDANSGRLLQRFRARQALGAPSRYFAASDEPIPRPPGLVEGRLGGEPLVSSPTSRRAPQQEVARGDDSASPISNVAPAASLPDGVEKPRHKPAIVKRRKLDPAPVEQPVLLPAPASSPPTAETPAAPAIVSAPAPAAAPAIVAAPPAPAAPVVRVDSAPPVVAAPQEPRVAESKPAAEMAPAKSVRPRKPALNDLPVDPLE